MMASMSKNMTLRLEDVQAAEIEMVAAVDGHPVVEAIRMAISEYIERRRTAEDFQRRLHTNIERMRRMISPDAAVFVMPLEVTQAEIDARKAQELDPASTKSRFPSLEDRPVGQFDRVPGDEPPLPFDPDEKEPS